MPCESYLGKEKGERERESYIVLDLPFLRRMRGVMGIDILQILFRYRSRGGGIRGLTYAAKAEKKESHLFSLLSHMHRSAKWDEGNGQSTTDSPVRQVHT